MSQLETLIKHLKRGNIYRRDELVKWSKAIDRHLEALVANGTLQKLSQGLYYFPKLTVFGPVPPEESALVRSFLKDDRFLLTSSNAYNSLGLGTTQLYNERVVYNHKRHGHFSFGNRKFDFRVKPHFPKKATAEFLLVDLVNNLDTLAEDQAAVLKNLPSKVQLMDKKKLQQSVAAYGNNKTKKILSSLMQ